MKKNLLSHLGICSTMFVMLVLISCTKQDDNKLLSGQEVIETISNEIGVSESHMTLSVMPSTSLGKFQDHKLVNESILSDGEFAMILIDESAYMPNHYEFISFPNSVSGKNVDFIMLMSVEDEVRETISETMHEAKAPSPDGPNPGGPNPDLPKLGLHCAGAGVCFIMRGGNDNCTYGKPCGALEDLPL